MSKSILAALLLSCSFVTSAVSADTSVPRESADRGHWCLFLRIVGSESSACVRKEEQCRAGQRVAEQEFGEAWCEWRDRVWSSRIKVEGVRKKWFFATEEHCEVMKLVADGSPCQLTK